MFIKNPPVRIADSLAMLGLNEYPMYLVSGDGAAAVFEGGAGPVGPVVAGQIDGIGIDPAQVRQIVVPHAHPDHVMAVPRLRELFPEAEVLASQPAAAVMANEKAIGFFTKMDDAVSESLVRDGTITEDQRRGPLPEPTIAVDRTIGEGDTIDVGGTALKVLATPGHSECSLSFHDAAGGVLIASDAVPYYFPAEDVFWPNYFTSYADYLASLRRLKDLGAEVLCLGHHGAVQGADAVAAFLDRAIAATEAYHERIVRDAKAGKPVREIAEQLGAEVHAKTQLLPLDFFQKNCGLMVKLSMKHAGISAES